MILKTSYYWGLHSITEERYKQMSESERQYIAVVVLDEEQRTAAVKVHDDVNSLKCGE